MGDPAFRDYQSEGECWITLSTGEYYPDILESACRLYGPVLSQFRDLLRGSHSSVALFTVIAEVQPSWMRIQLCRVFRKYVSPETPVEMLKIKSRAARICAQYGNRFRHIVKVQERFETRPLPDEALCAVLWEYKDRGKKGYDLTEEAFGILRNQFPGCEVLGPERAGKDVPLGSVLPGYPKPGRPVDFVLKRGSKILAIGLARYDSDRGGAQEDDRTGQYREVVGEVLAYAEANALNTLKIIFVNDGPGLLLGSMWRDYADLEDRGCGRVRVATLRMMPERITPSWVEG